MSASCLSLTHPSKRTSQRGMLIVPNLPGRGMRACMLSIEYVLRIHRQHKEVTLSFILFPFASYTASIIANAFILQNKKKKGEPLPVSPTFSLPLSLFFAFILPSLLFSFSCLLLQYPISSESSFDTLSSWSLLTLVNQYPPLKTIQEPKEQG